MLSPRQFSRVADTAEEGILWGADNDCFQRLDVVAYRKMLDAITDVPNSLFVVVPDVVGEWRVTRFRFWEWQREVAATGQPVAYVAQDGQPGSEVPWERIGCLFIGGSTSFKLSPEAERLGREAKRRGLWLHMGRVNSRKRFDYARATGCDSIDGSKFSRWRNTWLPEALSWHTDHLQERIPG